MYGKLKTNSEPVLLERRPPSDYGRRRLARPGSEELATGLRDPQNGSETALKSQTVAPWTLFIFAPQPYNFMLLFFAIGAWSRSMQTRG